MNKAVISGDIISSTGLSNTGRELIENSLKELLYELSEAFNAYGRIIKGDYLECVVPKPHDALRVALIIKSFVKSIPIEKTPRFKTNKRVKLFKTHGIRLAIGYGELSRFDPGKGIIDGDAIYLSGRTINEHATHEKERIVIKNTLYFVSKNTKLNEEIEPMLALLDVLMAKATARQSKVLYMKLMSNNENDIASKLNIAQSVVNQHSTSIGWNAVEKTVNYFSELIKKHQ